ncbi:MAG: PD40 domain-containing protein [Chloroflexi bacterium]|nr:PD40 domain-containing protein [Chloroflexota bacterium]
MSVNPFQRAEDEYFRLKGQLATGRITQEQFDAAVKELLIQDAQKRYWMLGPDSGKWYVHDGTTWVEAQLPASGSSAIKQPSPETSVAKSPRRRIYPLLIITCIALLCGLVAVGGLLFASRQGLVNLAMFNAPTPTRLAPTLPSPLPTLAPQPTFIAVSPSPTVFAPTAPVAVTPTQSTQVAPAQPTQVAPTPGPTLQPSTQTPAPLKRLDLFPGFSGSDGVNVIDAATNATFLVYGQPGVASAAWSPDGKKLLVSSSAPQQGNFYRRVLRTVNADGSNITDIHMVMCDTFKAGCSSWGPFEALWSPDGKKILARELVEQSGLVLRNASDGQAPQSLPSSPLEQTRTSATDIPRFWSVDGQWVIAISTESGNAAYALEVNGKRRVPVSTLGKIQVYDQRFYPWKVMDAPINCKSFEYFNCP